MENLPDDIEVKGALHVKTSSVPIPLSKSQKEIAVYFFRHFSMRLSERYGILITFDYYVILCGLYLRSSKIVVKNGRKPVLKGILKINDVKVNVYKDIKKNMLLTALPNK